MRLVYFFPLFFLLCNGRIANGQYPPAVAPLIQTLESRLASVAQQLGLVNATNAALFNPSNPPSTNNTLGLPTLEDAQYYMFFSGAVYCYGSPILTSWTCDYCRATGPSVSFHSTLFNSLTQVAGMINVNDEDKKIIVTFRGSYAEQNFDVDLLLVLVPWAGVNPDVKVHSGFLYYANSIYAQVRSNLLPLAAAHPDYKIVIGGHSLGSALATLTILRLLSTEPAFQGQDSRFSAFLYAPPRVGDVAFAQWANSFGFDCARIVHYADLVPHLFPPLQGYAHFGTEYWIDEVDGNQTVICRSDLTEDPDCSNSLAPVYDLTQHFWYYGVSYFNCLMEDPVNGAVQISPLPVLM